MPVTDLPWTWHGGALEAARRHFGEDGAPWIDLSTGINPRPWSGIDGVAIDWRRLPEQDVLAGLEAAAAGVFGIDPAQVCAVPGSEIGLRLAGRLIGGNACHVAPTYGTHGAMFGESRAVGWADAGDCDGALIVANPNNPDGRIIPPEQLLALFGRRGGARWLLVDEAFADCDPSISVAPHVRGDRLLVVFRSFGKFFGLAGLRLGFVLGPAALLAELRVLLGAWPVSAAAATIGTEAYRDTDWIAATRQALRTSAAELDRVLARHGYSPRGGCPLFRLVETADADGLFRRLARAAILTRPFADQPGWLRLGLPADAEALARLDAALPDG